VLGRHRPPLLRSEQPDRVGDPLQLAAQALGVHRLTGHQDPHRLGRGLHDQLVAVAPHDPRAQQRRDLVEQLCGRAQHGRREPLQVPAGLAA
jgi:hypothetical protein